MKRIVDTSEILGTVDTEKGRREVCISAEAKYDEAKGILTVKLKSFLRNTDLVAKEKHFVADWLPKPETVRENIGPEESGELAREIFHRWERKVRQAVPSLHHA